MFGKKGEYIILSIVEIPKDKECFNNFFIGRNNNSNLLLYVEIEECILFWEKEFWKLYISRDHVL